MENDCELAKSNTLDWSDQTCAVIVAHPDDETLWAGGIILAHPEAAWHIITLCRGSDTDRAPKFKKILTAYNAAGAMADIDDGPDQTPLNLADIQEKPSRKICRTTSTTASSPTAPQANTPATAGTKKPHKPFWTCSSQTVSARPRCGCSPIRTTTDRIYRNPYPPRTYTIHCHRKYGRKKYDLITNTYGFSADSWEARTTPKTEAFWTFTSAGRRQKTNLMKRSKAQ